MVRNTSKNQYKAMTDGTRFLFLEDTAYLNNIASYRKSCKLPDLLLIYLNSKPDFTGAWIFNEEKSTFDNFGASFLPFKMIVSKNENELNIQKTFVQEFTDDRITDEKVTLDGKETRTEMFNSPRIMKTRWSNKGDTLIIESKVIFNRGDSNSEMILNEDWNLKDNGSVLSIKRYSKSFYDERKITMVFDKQ
jgi:hypothetical protein